MIYDLIIIGGSASGTTAGIYAARRNLKFLIIAKDLGGEVATSGEIGNWPGIIQIDGLALAQQFRSHLESYMSEIKEDISVNSISENGDATFIIKTSAEEYQSKAIIVATGVHSRELNISGEKEFRNKGLSYCTTCDGPLFKNKIVATIGGGNAALESVLMLSDIAEKVYLINKNAQFKGEQVLIDKVQSKNNIEIIYEALTSEIMGSEFVGGLKYGDKNGTIHELKVDGVFVHIGQIPNSSIVPDAVEKDQFGQIIVNTRCETNVSGIFAAGDVTDVAYKQIIIACGQGCVAALSAVEYLNRK